MTSASRWPLRCDELESPASWHLQSPVNRLNMVSGSIATVISWPAEIPAASRLALLTGIQWPPAIGHVVVRNECFCFSATIHPYLEDERQKVLPSRSSNSALVPQDSLFGGWENELNRLDAGAVDQRHHRRSRIDVAGLDADPVELERRHVVGVDGPGQKVQAAENLLYAFFEFFGRRRRQRHPRYR